MDLSKCLKCGDELSDMDKSSGLPLCENCLLSLIGIIQNKLSDVEKNKNDLQIENFSYYILSSGRLMGLSDSTIAHACFNIFMDSILKLSDSDVDLAGMILNVAIENMKAELENLRNKKNDFSSSFIESLENALRRRGDLIDHPIDPKKNEEETDEGIDKSIKDDTDKTEKD